MVTKFLYLLIATLLLGSAPLQSQEVSKDENHATVGPYILKDKNILYAIWIERGKLRKEVVDEESFGELKKNFGLACTFEDLKDVYSLKAESKQNYDHVDSIGVITDVHGEYNIYIDLLKAMGIIDVNLNWSFGNGHLVVLGDMFDRGNMVSEVLWHLFGLEKQAARAGGMVHILIGNHESMVLNDDLRYINKKYNQVALITNTEYSDLYSENSVIGKWLRTRPVMIKINNILFVHAGISIEMVHRELDIRRVNKIFSDRIIGQDLVVEDEMDDALFLSDSNGPLWYRGYFSDGSFCESRLDSILNFYDVGHIVVGHTINDCITALYNDKIIGADAGISLERPGEMLIYKEGVFYRGFVDGKRLKL